MAAVLTEETRSALSLSSELPSLPELGGAGLEGALGDAVSLWTASWDRTVDVGRRMRASAYADAANPLADVLGDDGIRTVLRQVDEALEASEPLLRADLSPQISTGIVRARLLRDQGARALDGGRATLALRDLLEASDALRELGPQAVAQALLARAEEALASGSDLSELDLDRAEHLILGAHMALDNEDWTSALRRAFYACQVLGVSPY